MMKISIENFYFRRSVRQPRGTYERMTILFLAQGLFLASRKICVSHIFTPIFVLSSTNTVATDVGNLLYR